MKLKSSVQFPGKEGFDFFRNFGESLADPCSADLQRPSRLCDVLKLSTLKTHSLLLYCS